MPATSATGPLRMTLPQPLLPEALRGRRVAVGIARVLEHQRHVQPEAVAPAYPGCSRATCQPSRRRSHSEKEQELDQLQPLVVDQTEEAPPTVRSGRVRAARATRSSAIHSSSLPRPLAASTTPTASAGRRPYLLQEHVVDRSDDQVSRASSPSAISA